MFDKIKTRKDVRLYFMFEELMGDNLDLGKLKTELIKMGYIEHVEGDKWRELKKIPISKIADELRVKFNIN